MTEQEFHDSRIPFYVEGGYEQKLVILPTGLSHKEAIPSWKYKAVEKKLCQGLPKRQSINALSR